MIQGESYEDSAMVGAFYYIRRIDVIDRAIIVHIGSYTVADALNGCIHNHRLNNIRRYSGYDYWGRHFSCKTKETVSSQP